MMLLNVAIAILSVAQTGSKPVKLYVAPTGDDSNIGTEAKPFKTIQKGVESVAPGMTLIIKGGIYKEKVVLKKSGSYFGREITIQGEPGQEVVLDASGLGGYEPVFDTGGQDHLILRNLAVKNARGEGIAVRGSWQVRLEDCRSAQTGASGIIIDKAHIVFATGCKVTKACQTGGEESVSIKRSTDVIFEKGHVYQSGHEGIDVKEGSKHVIVRENTVEYTQAQGLYADAWDSDTYDITFDRNIVHHCMAGATVSTESGGYLRDVWITNNVIYDCRGPGMIVTKWGDKRFSHRMKNLYFINNTVVNNGHGADHPTWGGGMLMENDQAENVVIYNNVLSGNPDGQLRITMNLPPKSYDVRNNLLDGVTENFGKGNIVAPAQFVDLAKKDFRLKPGSKAIDAGYVNPWSGNKDLGFGARTKGKSIDIGAYEH